MTTGRGLFFVFLGSLALATAIAQLEANRASTAWADEGDTQAAQAIPPAAMKEAHDVFVNRCATCHGATGKGDGPASAVLNPKPRDLSDPQWQESVTDKYIDDIIKLGGAAIGRSPMMPANPDLATKPDVLIALRKIIRGL